MNIKKLVAFAAAVIMLCSALPLAAFAEWNNVVFEGTAFGTDEYYNVISKKDWVLVPDAATETEMVLNNADGTRRQVLHIIEVDPSNPDVSIVPGYYGIDKDLTNVANQKAAYLTDTAAYYEDTFGYNIVGGMNTDLTYASNAPRVLVYNGKDLRIGNNTSSMLLVYKIDGVISCEVSAYNSAKIDAGLADGTLLHAVPISFGMVVKDGELVNKTVKRGNDDAARSMVGVKEDGTLVLCMNDGRNANNSIGLSSYEEGEVMLALGCKWAANCDGGGSSTFLTKRVGEETFTMRSVPCDGAQRATLHGVFVASNVGPTGVLDVVNVHSDYDYFAPNTVYTFGAQAIDTNGYGMTMPADIAWSLSDASFGTIADGKFVSNGKLGEVDVQITSGGAVVGTKTITVAHPTTLMLSATTTVMPYSTEEKIREITMPIVAQIGEANVYYDTNAIAVSLSNTAAGTMDGFKFTATSDTTVTGTDITMTYTATDTSLVYSVTFGKGSEVIFDFEDGDVSDWMGFQDAKNWSVENGVNNSLVGSSPLAGQFSEKANSTTFLSTATNGGQVKNGNNALAWKLDNRNVDFANWTYNVLFNVGETIVLRDVANGMKATTLGMWLYIPEGAAGLAFQSQFYTKNANGTYTHKQDHFMFVTASGVKKNLNSCTEADIPESRWVYASIDISKYDYLCVPVMNDTGSRAPSFIRTYIKPTVPAELTFYIDDITLDYSSAVDDRVQPTISDLTYVPADTAITLENGAVIAENQMAFAATVSDNEALNASSAKVYIDGVAVNASVAGKTLATEDVTLLSGEHTLTMEIADELGNVAKVTRTFTVSGDPAITLGGHNDLGTTPEAGSIYYVDIQAADIANVSKVTAVLKLQNANTWEAEGTIVADGFTATTSYNEVSQLLTVTVEANGEEINTEAEALVSIPVRVWSWNGYDYVKNTAVSAETQFAGSYCPVVTVDCEVVSGEVTFADKTSGTFGGEISVETMVNDVVNPWHVHDAELVVLSEEGTCVKDGYENRTYCNTCGSVVDWGDTVKASNHNYEFVDGSFVCTDCDAVRVLGTELFEVNGKYYYSIAGKLVSGWQYIDDEWHYFDETTYTTVASKTFNFSKPVTYQFTEDGKVVSGVWVELDAGTRYYYGPDYYQVTSYVSNMQFFEIDGKLYGFNGMGFRYEGLCFCKESTNPTALYVFGDDGVFQGMYTGLYEGKYYANGKLGNGAGVIEFEGDLYYIKADGTCYVGNIAIGEAKSNGLLADGRYTFGADGKLVVEEIKNGIVDGKYYVDNVLMTGAGVVEVDGDLYYITASGKVYVGVIAIGEAKSNGLLADGRYTFGSDGKLVVEEAKNGIVDGKYYVDNVLMTGAGVVEVDGDLYYITASGKVYVGTIAIGAAKSNGLLADGRYKFGADGKLIVEAPKNGIVDGKYYENNVLMNGAGVVEVDGAFYYVLESGKIYVDGTLSIGAAKTNSLINAGRYSFGADGKMIIKNGVIDGKYYVNGELVKGAGVVEVDGDYYYIKANGAVYVGSISIGASKTNGLIKAGAYTFGADGKMITA